jgi:hypothetical protein
MSCRCETGTRGVSHIGPKGVGCFALGRAGDCLWDDSELEPCTPADDKCPALCEELEARYAADAKKVFDAEARYSACHEGWCHSVLRIEDACFADRSYQNGRSYDCSLSDEDILARETQARVPKQLPKCSELPETGGTCVRDAPNAERDCVQRPEGEWQGIPVCAPYPPCSSSDHCGVALACIDSKCRGCTQDDQCANGEGCVLDHCVPEANIGCHVRADCKAGELCILNGLTSGTVRANEDTRAYCQGSSGGSSMKR